MEFLILIAIALVFFLKTVASASLDARGGPPGFGENLDADNWSSHIDEDGREHFVDEEGYCEDCDEYHN